eukprot:GEZU01005278.1.p1 GENE.GEZU01005278.1~~GEZU01005278.1.p1  ORF type:complete len:210 (+),score=48.03 GEZU01005278.1:91-630(+)
MASANNTNKGGAFEDLVEYIDRTQSECLNADQQHGLNNALIQPNEDLQLWSDTDPQLLIKLAFKENVKIHSIMISGPSGNAPRKIKLFTDRPNIGFSEATDEAPKQELTLTEEDTSSGKQIPLNFVKFQNVTHLTIFIEDNQGDEEVTKVSRLIVYGQKRETTKMSEFKRVAGEKGEVE